MQLFSSVFPNLCTEFEEQKKLTKKKGIAIKSRAYSTCMHTQDAIVLDACKDSFVCEYTCEILYQLSYHFVNLA